MATRAKQTSGKGDESAANSPAAGGKSKPSLVEPSWFGSADGGPPLTELLAENQGALSPFGEDTRFPLPPGRVNYEHPTAKPNRAEYR